MNDLQCGKAGEYLVCADLIIKGFIAFLSEQGLPFDVVLEYGGRLLKVQVKTTRGLRNVPQRKIKVDGYIFNIKRRGKNNGAKTSQSTCDLFALVCLDTGEIGYLINRDVRETMNFRATKFKGEYRDENIKIKSTGRYLSELTLEKCLCQLAK